MRTLGFKSIWSFWCSSASALPIYTVGLAQRIEQLATPGTAYLTEHTARMVEGFFQLRDMGEFNLKGAQAPIHVFELEAAGPLRTRLDLSRASPGRHVPRAPA